MTSIFNVPVFDPDSTYSQYDIVIPAEGVNTFYYALQNVPLGIGLERTDYWGGVLTYNGETKPNFFWRPSYNSTVNHEPKTKFIQFGDGFEQRYADGINSNPFTFDWVFDLRSDAETNAICHFLINSRGITSFFFTAPAPYNQTRKYICKNWQHTFVFADNNSIKMSMIERVN